MKISNGRRKLQRLLRIASVVGIVCLYSVLLFCPTSKAQNTVSLASQAQQWLMQDAPPNPPLRAWLDGMSMMIKEKNANVDASVRITSKVLPSGLVEVQAKVGPNILLWQVNYTKRKYYCMNKFTSDFMDLIAKSKPLR